MSWKTIQTDQFFPTPEGLVYNEIASLMSLNEDLAAKVHVNFWGKDRSLLGSPNPRQDYLRDEYYRQAADNPQNRILTFLLYGATRSGKTDGVIALFIEALVKYPGARALGVRRTYAQLADSLIDSVAGPGKFLDRMGYVRGEDYEFRGGDRPGIFFKNGSSWIFRSTERANKAGEGKADNLGGTEYDLVMMEEADEIDELYYTTLVSRMSGRRCPARGIFLVENPPSEDHWTHKRFILRKISDPTCHYTAIHFPTEDNERHLPEGYINSLEEEYKEYPALYRKFRLGLFTPAVKGKPIFQGYFQRRIHVPSGDKALTWDQKLPLWRIWDFGFRHPAMVVGQEDPKTGQIKWLRAHLGNDELLMPFAKRMINNCKKWYPGATFVDICDQAGKKRSALSEKNEIQVLEGLGLRPRYKYSRIEYGVQLLYQELSSILPGGIPAMVFDPVHCSLLIDAFEFGYTQDPDAKDDVIKPVKDNRHDHCLVGSTEIRTLEGWLPLRDLVGKDEFWVLAWSEQEKRLVPARAHNAHLTRKDAPIWELQHDGGSVFATPDHRFMLRDGTYKELQHLAPGDELMPMYEVERGRTGHRSIKLNDGSVVYEHQYVYARLKGNLRDGYEIHHQDHNGKNNNPTNLVQLTPAEHRQQHKTARKQRLLAEGKTKGPAAHDWKPDSREKVSAWAKRWYAANRTEKQCLCCGVTFMGIPRSKYCSVVCQQRVLGKKRRDRDKRTSPSRARHTRGTLRSFGKNNHKVVQVRDTGRTEDVYCLCVPGYHNFAANGVFVHNCMDCCRYAVVMFRELQNQNVPRKVANRLYRKITASREYEEKMLRDIYPSKGPSYNFGKRKGV